MAFYTILFIIVFFKKGDEVFMDKILNIIYVSCGLVASLITLFNLNTLKVELLKLFILNKEREDDELY